MARTTEALLNASSERREPLAGGRPLAFLGLVAAAGTVSLAVLAMQSTSYDTWGALVAVPPIILITTPILRREARREGDSRVFWFLLAMLLIKLIGGLARFLFDFGFYQGGADALGYHLKGADIAQALRSGSFESSGSLTGTHFIEWVTGVIYVLIGTTKLGGFVVFSWIGFWGLFFFRRAFVLGVPGGNKTVYGILLFLTPTILLYTSGTGKDAWMMLSLGLAAYGATRMFAVSILRGFPITVVGVWFAALVRPHVAAAIAIAVVLGFGFAQPRSQLRQLGPPVKWLSLAILVTGTVLLIVSARGFLERAGIDTDKGLAPGLGLTAERTSIGGSEFEAVTLDTPAKAPVAAATVLYRPSIVEARNIPALMASIESSLLALITLLRLPSIGRALTSLRRRPYLAVALAHVAMMVIALSSLANFGLLVRQRTSLLPMFFVLLAVPKPGRVVSTPTDRRPV